MKFASRDPDIETIVRRINDGDYDLQPDFQRGDVWPLSKQKRLIDSVLREWHIPPVHLVARDSERSDVLDGQQRLTAIRSFMADGFSVDGTFDPEDSAVRALDGLKYSQLPVDAQKRFRRFTIRIFELTDFEPSEPHELFFRLNQPTNLTEAEKRNAFVGMPRNQVKELVEYAKSIALDASVLGFTNARMAHDDVFARFLITLESGALTTKVTAARVTARYRDQTAFSQDNVLLTRKVLDDLVSVKDVMLNRAIKFNKATLHTWLCFLAELRKQGGEQTVMAGLEALLFIEENRWGKARRASDSSVSAVLAIFQDRSTARVADVSSVVLRDLIAHMLLARNDGHLSQILSVRHAGDAWQLVSDSEESEGRLLDFAYSMAWGEREF